MAVRKIKIRKLNTFYRVKEKRTFFHSYFCKSRLFRACFKDCSFLHVNFRGSIMTACSFKNCELNDVEFSGTNLRRSNFRNSKLKNVTFVAALLDDCNFAGATFENVLFVNTNIAKAKNLDVNNPNIKVMYQYPKVEISQTLQVVLEELRMNEHIVNYKVLHLSTKKYNHLSLHMLLEHFSEEQLISGMRSLNSKINKSVCTVYRLRELLYNELRRDKIKVPCLTQSRS